jgi:outer membrane murein-binding lipoprotein Lpp
LLAVILAGCDSPRKTVDQLRQEITAYKDAPSEAAKTKIDEDFAKLGTQIAKLEAKGKTSDASAYRASAENLRADYRAAQMVHALKDAQSAVQGIGNALQEAGKSFGDAFRAPAKPSATPK